MAPKREKRRCEYCGEQFEIGNNSRRDACDICIAEMLAEGVYFTQQPKDPTVYRPRYGFKQFERKP